MRGVVPLNSNPTMDHDACDFSNLARFQKISKAVDFPKYDRSVYSIAWICQIEQFFEANRIVD